jgi:hypothetical protein
MARPVEIKIVAPAAITSFAVLSDFFISPLPD